jgi:Tol biopolymer transport system component
MHSARLMGLKGLFIATVGTILLAFLMIVVPAGAVVPGENGRIVFTRVSGGPGCTQAIVAADPNDANENVLATYPCDELDGLLTPNWSPDGGKVVFAALGGIWTVNADGSGLRELIACHAGDTGCLGFAGPTFTPDGRHIVTEHCCEPRIGDALYILNADGTRLKALTREPDDFADTVPQVSPDGRRIVFNRCAPPNGHPCTVDTVNIHGANRRQLTEPALDTDNPNWSPDGSKIVFTMQPAPGAFDLATMNADGSGLDQLTFNPPGGDASFQASFAPDGTEILFTFFSLTDGFDLYTMNPDGTGSTQLTETQSDEFEPEWAVAR